MKVTRKGTNVFPEFKRYSKIIEAAQSHKEVTVYYFATSEQAQLKSNKLKSWKYKVITQARSAHGFFTKGFVLICCR
jgi:hypothetical protein